MGALLGWLRSAFGYVFASWFGGEIKSVALITAYIAAFLVITTGLILAFKAILATIIVTAPASLQWGLGFLPNNVPTCITAIIDARLAWWVYSYKSGLLNKKISSYGRK